MKRDIILRNPAVAAPMGRIRWTLYWTADNSNLRRRGPASTGVMTFSTYTIAKAVQRTLRRGVSSTISNVYGG